LIERGPGLGKNIHSGAGRHCVAARPREEFGAKPIFEQANLPANGAVRDVELLRGPREATEPRGGFEGFDPKSGSWLGLSAV